MSKVIDARGLSCPQPVILVMKAIERGEFPIEAIVDTATARENVSRMAQKSGCQVEITPEDGDFRLIVKK